MNGTVIGKRLLLNESDSNGNLYPNLDIRYGPYKTVKDAIETLSTNKWLVPFLTVGVVTDNGIEEYWVNKDKQLVSKSTNTIVNNITTKVKDEDDDKILKDIASLQSIIENIIKDCNSIKEVFNVEDIKTDFANVIKMIDDNTALINVVKEELKDVSKRVESTENSINKFDSYTRQELDNKFNSYRMSVNNINVVLQKHKEEHEKRFNDIVRIDNSLTDINNQIATITDNYDSLQSHVTIIEKNIKEIEVSIQYLMNIYNSIKSVSEKINNVVIDYTNKFDDMSDKINSSASEIININNKCSSVFAHVENKKLICNLQIEQTFVINWEDDEIDTIRLIVDNNIGKYKNEYDVVIYGNNYKLETYGIVFNNNDVPVLLKNTITHITIDNITHIATYKQINNN